MFFCGQHKDGENELCCQEHLDEDTLRHACSTAKCSGDCQRAREKRVDNSSSCHASKHLGNEDESATCEGDSTDEAETESDLKCKT